MENTTIEWKDNAPDASLTQKVLTAKEKMLLTSRLYLKVEAMPTESDLNRPTKTDRSRGSPVEQ